MYIHTVEVATNQTNLYNNKTTFAMEVFLRPSIYNTIVYNVSNQHLQIL